MIGYAVKASFWRKSRIFPLILSLVAMAAGESSFLDTNDVLPSVRRVINNKKLHKLKANYTDGFVAHAVLRLSEHIDLQEEVGNIQEAYRAYAEGQDPKYSRCVDNLAFGCSLFDLYRVTEDDRWMAAAKKCSDYQINNLTSKGGVDSLLGCTRFWVDDIAMIGVLQASAYHATNEKIYADWLGREMNAFLENEICRESGLFWHTSSAPHFWGRGNGWAAAGLAEALLVLPEDDPHHANILSGFVKLIDALIELQQECGMWRQILDHPDSFLESSGTALFCSALATGIRKEWFEDPQPYMAALKNAWTTLSTEYIDDEGNVLGSVGGTSPANDINDYLDRETEPGNNHGTCAFLWAGMALIELLDSEPSTLTNNSPRYRQNELRVISKDVSAYRILDVRGRASKATTGKGVGIVNGNKILLDFTDKFRE